MWNCANITTKDTHRRSAMDKASHALSTFDSGFNCSQSVLTAFCNEFGFHDEMAFRTACGFGGGMGRMAKTCGAVTGAFMVIGLKYGQTQSDDKAAKEKTYGLVKTFADIFAKKYGSIECHELLACDINTPEGLKIANEKNLFKTICPKYIESAVKILEKLI
jgi:C_GCAxxG_C_C family probable redox protein